MLINFKYVYLMIHLMKQYFEMYSFIMGINVFYFKTRLCFFSGHTSD